MANIAPAHTGPVLHDPLDPGNIEAIVTGRHGAPFDVLGSHLITIQGTVAWVVRVFRPHADAIYVAPHRLGEADKALPEAIPMTLIHPAGLFSAVIPHDHVPRYHLDVQWPFGVYERKEDVYAFPPVLSEYDLYLMGEGRHLNLYDKLGAHPMTLDGVAGVAFAVWAPSARRVSVAGDFNGWDERVYPMRMRPNGVWELFLPDLKPGALYKYSILSWANGYQVLKSDPFAFYSELRPGTASVVFDIGGYEWGDAGWMERQREANAFDAPMTIYELHAGSWKPPTEGNRVSYRDLARQLVPYVKEMGYTHVELMPVAEHPFDGSWGYQVTGYYAPTSRYGNPHDFMYFVDYLHQHDIGVILDWVPAHFPKDAHGLAFFDGTHLYEHADPRQGAHPDWGTLVFNYGRNEVRNFFIANALYWFDRFHIDGLRVDAVASMLYLDYSRKAGEWVANRYGGRENLEAIAFLRECNQTVRERYPAVLMIAEESTAWPGVTTPVSEGGLGFSLKWNMGWMHDTLEYIEHDPVYRKHHHGALTFSMVYAYSERFILPFSHDEVVHLKKAMLDKMPGDMWQKYASLRSLYGYMYGHPGKKLLFMGDDFGQWHEWNYASYLDWWLLDLDTPDGELHRRLRYYVRDLNVLVRDNPSLHALDFSPEGFRWIDFADAPASVIAFMRLAPKLRDPLVFVCNFTPVPRYNYRIGVPAAGYYQEVLNSDAEVYGGSNVGNLGRVRCEPVPMHGLEQSIPLTLPPLATIVLKPGGRKPRRPSLQDGAPA